MLESTDNIKKNSDVFISYCSAQREYADCLRKMLTERGVKCWMAPYSIPTGSSYQTEIPSALSNTPNVLLVLSKEAETSRWVQKEIGCAIGARHKLIPIRSYMYEISPQFNFLLDGEQIYDVDNKLDMEENCAKAADYLLKIIKPDDIEKLCENNKKLNNEEINNKKACGIKTYKNVSKNKSAKRNIFDLMKDKILISLSCATMTSGKFMFGEESYSLLLFPIIEDKVIDTYDKSKYFTEERKKKLSSQKQMYDDKNKFFIACTVKEAKNKLFEWLDNKNE